MKRPVLTAAYSLPDNYEHISGLAVSPEVPFVANPDFIDFCRTHSLDGNEEAFYERYGWLKDLLGGQVNANKTPDLRAYLTYEDKLTQTGSFRNSAWHVDSGKCDETTLLSTSTAAEFAGCVIDFSKKLLSNQETKIIKRLQVDGSIITRERGQGVLLNNLSTLLGYNWLEVAGGLCDAPERQKRKIAKFVCVDDLAIVQLMPCVAASGPMKTLLHRSAEKHPLQPNSRVLTRVSRR